MELLTLQNNFVKVAFLVSHDAYLKGALGINQLLKQRGENQTVIYTINHLLHSDYERIDLNSKESLDNLTQFNFIFAGLGGKHLNQLIAALNQSTTIRPKVISYFPGIIHFKELESLLSRVNSDAVLINNKVDERLYKRLSSALDFTYNGVLFGCPWLEFRKCRELEAPSQIDLLFIEQSIVPDTSKARLLLIKKLVNLAQANPEKLFCVALRAKKGASSSHAVEFCLEELFIDLDIVVDNLFFSYENIEVLVNRSRVVTTISSSAAYIGLAQNKTTVFINDFGVNSEWGNDLFVYSGYFKSLQSALVTPFKLTRWAKKNVQQPRISHLNKALTNQPSSLNGKKHLSLNKIKLVLFVIYYSIRFQRNMISEIKGLWKMIKNINRKIYKV